MVEKTITFTDYNGTERTGKYYFNYSKAEIYHANASIEGGLHAKVKKIMEDNNPKEIMDFFKNFILDAYGEKSADGLHFVKSPEISKAFEQTEAYSELYSELVTDADKASAFFNALIPKGLVTDVENK